MLTRRHFRSRFNSEICGRFPTFSYSFIIHSPLSFKGALGQTLRDKGVEQSTVESVITAHTQGPEVAEGQL